MADNEALLTEIRDNFTYDSAQWAEIRDEAKIDIQYVAGNPWTEEEREERKQAGRPCLTLDELGQYSNQVINGLRQNPLAIKVIPKGLGANDKTAEMWGNIIRQVEYKSNAQSAYITAFENALQRGYGYFRINTEFESAESRNQVLTVRRIPNPDTVLFDWDCKEIDCSDADHCYVLDIIPKKLFTRRFPKATIVDFTSEHRESAKEWIRSDHIQVAEYWKVKNNIRELFFLEDGTADKLKVYQDEVPDIKPENGALSYKGKSLKILRDKKVKKAEVCQYITNGVEILEKNEWAGKYIPIVPVFGKELYVDEGGGAKRMLFSLIRLARDPYKLYCWLRSKEAEEAAMTPVVPYIIAEGQLEGHSDEWAEAHRVPRAYLQYKPMTEATGGQTLPPPTRTPFVPNFQEYEIACEAARRAIQAAMGISPLPTAAQRQNEKSGVALQRIETQQSQGSFHFIDNYKHALEHGGRIFIDLGRKIYDTEREVAIREADESNGVITINKSQIDANNPEDQAYKTDEGEHDVTISTGPSYQSQREQANEFVANFIQNVKNLPVQPEVMAKLLAISIKMLDLGPLGDELANLLSPDEKEQLPPQAQAAVSKLQQELQTVQGFAQKLHQDNDKLTQEKLGKVVEMQGRLAIVKAEGEIKKEVAQIMTKAQDAKLRAELDAEEMLEMHSSAHEAAMQAEEHAHESDQAQQAQKAASQSQVSDQVHQAGMAQQAQEQPAQ